jgi:hypothetical protein
MKRTSLGKKDRPEYRSVAELSPAYQRELPKRLATRRLNNRGQAREWKGSPSSSPSRLQCRLAKFTPASNEGGSCYVAPGRRPFPQTIATDRSLAGAAEAIVGSRALNRHIRFLWASTDGRHASFGHVVPMQYADLFPYQTRDLPVHLLIQLPLRNCGSWNDRFYVFRV